MLFQPGQLILNGKYHIDAFVGQGAFAEVYCATHVSLQAVRALKVLHREMPGVGSTDFRDYQSRFQLEARLGAEQNNPNLIQVFDFEQDGEALVLVMEYAAGGSLADRLLQLRRANQPMPIDEVLKVALDVANGLAALHNRDIVHRDLKPSNILFDSNGNAKVADLGLAQVAGGPSLRSTGSSVALPHPGTPAYMSPEQETTTVYLKPNSDVYALGLVLFEMLAGRNYKHVKPGMRASALRADNPAWIDDLLVCMLADEPHRRPWDGAEVAMLFHERSAIVGPGWEQQEHGGHERAQALQRVQAKAESKQHEKARFSSTASEHETPKRSDKTPKWMTRRVFLIGVAGIAAGSGGLLLLSSQSPDLPPAPTSTQLIVAEPSATSVPSSTPEPTTTPTNMPTPTGTLSPTDMPAPSATFTLQAPPASTSNTSLTLAQGATLELVRVPAGEFLMGSNTSDAQANSNESPQFRLSLDEYWIGRYNVTNAQFAAFVEATDYRTTAEQLGSAEVYSHGAWKDMPGADWRHPQGPNSGIADRSDYPVVQVTWDDTVSFCRWASEVTGREVRLPSEAQWEKAARGTDGRVYPWGNTLPDTTRANFNKVLGDVTPVGRYSPLGDSPYGITDMAGNVWGWTSSLYKPYPYQPSDGREDMVSRAARVLRGGCFRNVKEDIRCALRLKSTPDTRLGGLGFRVSL